MKFSYGTRNKQKIKKPVFFNMLRFKQSTDKKIYSYFKDNTLEGIKQSFSRRECTHTIFAKSRKRHASFKDRLPGAF